MFQRILFFLLFMVICCGKCFAQQTAITLDQETEAAPAPPSQGFPQAGILNPDQAWHDPTEQYRFLDPWRIAAEFGGGIMLYNNMAGETTQAGVVVNNTGERFENEAGVLYLKLELSGRVSSSTTQDWYFLSRLTYEGRSQDNVFRIRAGTHSNENIGFTLLNPLATTKVLNRNQTSAMTGIRVISRSGSFAYQGAYMTGIASRKWFEEDLLWVNRVEFDISYRFADALFGPFIAGSGDFTINSEEIARLEGHIELGGRYVNDVAKSWLTQIDGYAYVRGGKWNDDTDEVQAEESLGVIGGGARLRVWNLMLNMRVGYISNYSFRMIIAPDTIGVGTIRRDIDSSGDIEFYMSLSVAF